jgi:hypothetical protein
MYRFSDHGIDAATRANSRQSPPRSRNRAPSPWSGRVFASTSPPARPRPSAAPGSLALEPSADLPGSTSSISAPPSCAPCSPPAAASTSTASSTPPPPRQSPHRRRRPRIHRDPLAPHRRSSASPPGAILFASRSRTLRLARRQHRHPLRPAPRPRPRPAPASLRGKIEPDGSLNDDASPELRRIRRAMERQHRAIEESLRKSLRSLSEGGSTQDDLITIRGDRFVIPVKAEFRRKCPLASSTARPPPARPSSSNRSRPSSRTTSSSASSTRNNPRSTASSSP